VREAVGKPVKFIGTGEKLQALEAFYQTAWPVAFWAWVM